MAYNLGYRGANARQNSFPAQQNGMYPYQNFPQNPLSGHSGPIIIQAGDTLNMYYGPPPSHEPVHGSYSNIAASQHPLAYEQYPYAPPHHPNQFIPQNHPYNYNLGWQVPSNHPYNYNLGWQTPSNHPYNHNNGWSSPYHCNNSWQAPQNPPHNHQTTQTSGVDRPSEVMNGVSLSQSQLSSNQMASGSQRNPESTSSVSIPLHQGFAVTVPSTPEALHTVVPDVPKDSNLRPAESPDCANLNDTENRQQETGSQPMNMPIPNILSTHPEVLPDYEVLERGVELQKVYYRKEKGRSLESTINRIRKRFIQQGFRSLFVGFDGSQGCCPPVPSQPASTQPIPSQVTLDQSTSTQPVSCPMGSLVTEKPTSTQPVSNSPLEKPTSTQPVSNLVDPLVVDKPTSTQLVSNSQLVFEKPKSTQSVSGPIVPEQSFSKQPTLNLQPLGPQVVNHSNEKIVKYKGIFQNALPILISPGLTTKVHPYPDLDGKFMPNSTKSIDFVKSWITGLPQAGDLPMINNHDGNISNKRKRNTDADNSGSAAAYRTAEGVDVDVNDGTMEKKAPAIEKLASETKVDGLRRTKRIRKCTKNN